MKKAAVYMSILSIFACLAPASSAYESIPFRNGGHIDGVVEFVGNVIPKDKTYTISSDVKYCGKEIHTGKYLINAERKIKNVVVYIKDIKAGKPLMKDTVSVIDSRCTFLPHVSIGFKGNEFVLKNDDPLLHTAHIYSQIQGRTIFNVALPDKGSTITKNLTNAGIMELNCDCHPWMESFVYIFDHPYATITDSNGVFTINDIPPGVYTVEAWHESLGTVTLPNVTVQSEKINTIKLKFTGK